MRGDGEDMSDEKLSWTNERRKLSDLKPWPRNPRQIKNDQAERLMDSFNSFGQVETIAIGPDGEIYNGHQRLNVLNSKNGADYEVDVRVASRPLSEKEREKLTVYLHKDAAGEWDFDTLANEFEFKELIEWGFDEKELIGLDFGDEPPEDPGAQVDRAEELREKWQVETGQLWRIPSKTGDGEHRIICGDCTDKSVVERVMGGEKGAIAFTSPPYNAGVSAQLSGNTSIDDNLYRDEYDDDKTQTDYLVLLQGFTDCAIDVCKNVFVNIQILAGNKRAFVDYLALYRDRLADVAIWDKGHAAPAAAQRVMNSRFEFIFIFGESNANRAIGTNEFRGTVDNVYSGNPQRKNEFSEVHAATFPIDFPEYFIDKFTNNSDIVYEPFCGTGTTIIACERLGRLGRGIEISPAYVAVSLQRLADMGLEPVILE